MSRYIVIVEAGRSSIEANVGKLNYSGERYEIVARGKYADICALVSALNKAEAVA